MCDVAFDIDMMINLLSFTILSRRWFDDNWFNNSWMKKDVKVDHHFLFLEACSKRVACYNALKMLVKAKTTATQIRQGLRSSTWFVSQIH